MAGRQTVDIGRFDAAAETDLGFRGRGSISSSTTVPHLQVFLEGRSGGDGLAGILVHEGVGITGVSHTAGSNMSVVKGGSLAGNEVGVEGGGASHESKSNDLHDSVQKQIRMEPRENKSE